MAEKINIRGVYFDSVTLDGAADILMSSLENGKQCVLYTPNSEIVQACIDSPELYGVINSAELVIPDGIGVVKAGRILGTPFVHGKVAGIEVGEEIIKRLSGSGRGIFLLGGKPDIAEAARDKLSEKYGGLNFVGCHDGYFKKNGEENDTVIEEINKSGAEVLYVCLGAPAQEKWIAENRGRFASVKLMLALGGSLDGYAGAVKRAPKIFIKLGLEWFYRLLREPWRLKRMMNLPKFYFGTWKYKLSGK